MESDVGKLQCSCCPFHSVTGVVKLTEEVKDLVWRCTLRKLRNVDSLSGDIVSHCDLLGVFDSNEVACVVVRLEWYHKLVCLSWCNVSASISWWRVVATCSVHLVSV